MNVCKKSYYRIRIPIIQDLIDFFLSQDLHLFVQKNSYKFVKILKLIILTDGHINRQTKNNDIASLVEVANEKQTRENSTFWFY